MKLLSWVKIRWKLPETGQVARQFVELRHLGEHVSATLNRALTAYARMDVEAAVKIIDSDRVIDEEFDNISRLLITRMMEDPREIKSALRIFLVCSCIRTYRGSYKEYL